MTNKGLSKMSRGKIKKLSTGVQNFAPAYSEKLCTPNNINTQRIKKRKRKKDFPALKAGKGSTPETTQKIPQSCFGCRRRNGKARTPVLAFALLKNYMQKNSVDFSNL